MIQPRTRATVLAGAILLGAVVAIGGLWFDYRADSRHALAQTRAQLVEGEYARMRADIERFFTQAYQTIRTVALLPGVRAIEGGNRSDESEDVVELGRFSHESAETVQQLYNNLASNVSVSEIYAVLDGFTPDEYPFFMYDQLLLDASGDGLGDDGWAAEPVRNPDFPDESEEEEYAHFPLQIDHFKATAGRFDFSRMDDIPAISSPPMRTCDNTQYQSESEGDPANAEGILYSVPFYDRHGDLNGVISAIFRINVLEAQLLNLPFLPVLDEEQAELSALGLALPEHAGNFVLSNAQQSVLVADRRDAAFADDVRSRIATNDWDESFHVETLAIRDASPWSLIYRYDPVTLAQAIAPLQERLWLQLAGVLIVVVLLLFWVGYDLRRRRQLLAAADHLDRIAGGELTAELDLVARNELGVLLGAMQRVSAQLRSVVSSVRQGSDVVNTAARLIANGNEDLSARTKTSASALEEAHGSVVSVLETLKSTADGAQQADRLARQACLDAERGSGVARDAVQSMIRIRESSAKISEVASLVDSIAFQTNMLALNAAVEAARAGAQGRGFAVVASEVRDLASRSARSAREIKDLITESVASIEEGGHLVDETGASLEAILQHVTDVAEQVGRIASTAVEQERRVSEVGSAVGRLEHTSSQNTTLVLETASASATLVGQVEALDRQIAFFRTSDAEYPRAA